MPQCAWHPNTETNISCPDCGRYMCPKDMVDSPVGYKCKECGRARVTRGGVKPAQLARAASFGLAAAVVLAPFARLIPFFLIGSILYGALIGEATRRGAGGHRTWEFASIAAGAAFIGGAVVALVIGRPDILALIVGPIVAAVYVTSASWFA